MARAIELAPVGQTVLATGSFMILDPARAAITRR